MANNHHILKILHVQIVDHVLDGAVQVVFRANGPGEIAAAGQGGGMYHMSSGAQQGCRLLPDPSALEGAVGE